MSPQTKQLLISVPVGLLSLFGFLYLWRFADRVGINHWLSGVVMVTVCQAGATLAAFRRLDPTPKKGAVLLVLGLILLSAASLVNEYVTSFFTPSGAYIWLALLPSIIFAARHEFRKLAVANPDSVTDFEHWPFRILVGARIALPISVVVFLIGQWMGISKGAAYASVVAILFSVFLDAIMSYIFPKLAHQRPSNAFLAFISLLSIFAKPDVGRSQAGGMAILFLVLFACVIAISSSFL